MTPAGAAPRSADALDVLVDGAHLKDDHMRDSGNIDASADGIRGHQELEIAFDELLQDPEPRLLGPPGVARANLEGLVGELARELVRDGPLLDEDEHLAAFVLALLENVPDMLQEPPLLLLRLIRFGRVIEDLHFLNGALLDLDSCAVGRRAVCRRAVCNCHIGASVFGLRTGWRREAHKDAHKAAGAFVRQAAGELLHFPRPRGREHQHLPVRPDVARERRDVVPEARIEQPVDLGHREEGDTLKRNHLVRDEVDKAARRAYDEVRVRIPATEIADLLLSLLPAVHADRPDPSGVPAALALVEELAGLLMELHGQFPRGCKDEHHRRGLPSPSAVPILLRPAGLDVGHGRQQQCERLDPAEARAEARDRHDVEAVEAEGQHLGLQRA
mmetsp:Transcript_47858/g.154269  ORF Transcript_47858/g.154269 Transcript_47858/m.154269 type:complete len:388 (+) Transcript_47858:3964-5127(+)